MNRAVKSGALTKDFVRALQGVLSVGDFFSGAGTFRKVFDALIMAINDKFPEQSLQAAATTNLSP